MPLTPVQGDVISRISVIDETGRLVTSTDRVKKFSENIEKLSLITHKHYATGERAIKSVKTFTRQLEPAETWSKKLNFTQGRLVSSLQANNETLTASGDILDSTGKVIGRVENRVRELRTGMKPFRMELLSIMFFGMAIQRTFGGMVRQVMELTGVFEVWRAVLTMILLPILLPFSRVLMNIMFWIMQHPTVGKFVGWFIIFASVLGAIMAYIGIIGLGLGGIAKWVPAANLVAWFGKGGFWWKLATTAGVIYLLIDLISEIKEGDIVNVIADILGLAGFLLPVPPVAKGALFAVSAAVIFFGKGLGVGLTWEDFVTLLGFASLAGWKIGGPWGAVAAATAAVIFSAVLDWSGFKRSLENAWNWVKTNKFAMIIMSLVSAAAGFGIGYLKAGGGAAAAAPSYIGALTTGIIPTDILRLLGPGLEGPMQYGGYVPRSGLYRLHAGETVTPAGGFGGGGMTINVNAAVSSEMDVKRLADRISIELGRNFEREFGRRAL